jgi:hypothetical protein
MAALLDERANGLVAHLAADAEELA